MTSPAGTSEEQLLADALRAASDTRLLTVSSGARHETASAFAELFGSEPAIVVADVNTFAVAGRDVYDSLQRAGQKTHEPFIFGADVYAEIRCVDELQQALSGVDATPIAVGSGTINDLVKLAAHRLSRPYMVVATAASMDGYTAYGSSITAQGSKQTFNCPAPRGVLADLETIAAAPPKMSAAGYADLVAKIAAGADWMLADAAGVEPIHSAVWETVQGRLHSWVSEPSAVASGKPAALHRLINGLMMSGFAMQAAKTSRPASGAEHQFSHLWDMQHHTFQGAAPSHGFKVGIGTLASTALCERLLQADLGRLDIDDALRRWPTLYEQLSRIETLFGPDELAGKAREETIAKYPSPDSLRQQLSRLKSTWRELQPRLKTQLLPFNQLQDMLAAAGCPTQPEQIGISRQRLRSSFEQALCIRRRFTILDVAQRTGLWHSLLDDLFGPAGPWAIEKGSR
jgi:glycerol-1-phosphate dehydrogenase [NAD(P)+]